MTIEERLAAALTEEAQRIEPAGDGLQRIRARTQRAAVGWLRPAVAMAAVIVLLAAVWVSVSRQDRTPLPASPAASGSRGTQTTWHDVPVFYVCRSPEATLLCRESRDLSGARGRLYAAITAALSEPLDPDYETAWPSGTELLRARRDVEAVTVTLSQEAGRVRGNKLAALQLAYTVAAVYGDPDTPVRLKLTDGTLLGEVAPPLLDALGGPADYEDHQLAPAMVLAPHEGAQFSGEKITVRGEATVPTVLARVRSARNGELVWVDNVRTTQRDGGLWTWRAELKLPPGRYVVEVVGKELNRSRAMTDTKSFIVR